MAVALVAGAATMTGCDDDFDRPPVIVPEATIKANTTILDLKEQYWQGTTSDFLTTIGTTDTGEHVIIGGRVVSSDEDGNIYQRIVLEDETSSIFVRIYSTKLFESYQYGQEVRIDVTGLLIGTYRGLMMIGVDYNGSVGGMDLDVFQQRAQVNGLPDKAAIPQYVTTISDIKSYLTDETQLMTWQSRLITLENVEFVGGGSEMFGTPGAANYTTRQLKDAEGNTLDISTSNKCTFVNLLMPKGSGTVNAILSYYGSNWQLVFSDPETDCTGFTWVDTPETPDVPADGGDGSAETPIPFRLFRPVLPRPANGSQATSSASSPTNFMIRPSSAPRVQSTPTSSSLPQPTLPTLPHVSPSPLSATSALLSGSATIPKTSASR